MRCLLWSVLALAAACNEPTALGPPIAEDAGQVEALDAAIEQAQVAPLSPHDCQLLPECDSRAALQVQGTSPFGDVTFDELSVSYLAGITDGTQLAFRGESGAHRFVLIARLRPDQESDGVQLAPSPPGIYRADEAVILRPLRDGSCMLSQLTAELIVTEHDASLTPVLGETIRFNGALTVAGDGWDFRVDFQAQRACGTSLDE